MRRTDRRMSTEFAWATFDKCNYMTISVVDENNEPYMIPVLAARVDNHIYYHSFIHGRMMEIMKRSPKVCISAVHVASVIPLSNDLAFASCIGFGQAHIVDDPDEIIFGMRLICEKVAKDNIGRFESKIPFSMPHLGMIRIDIDRMTGKANLPGISQDGRDE